MATMAAPGWNPHKKGEHVFNDIGGSLMNSLLYALQSERARSLSLTGRFGNLAISDVPQTASAINNLSSSQILVQARTVVAPATGAHNDENSRTYSAAKQKLEQTLSEILIAAAGLIWDRKPRANSSFHEFEAIVKGMRDVAALKADASAAIDALIDSAHDSEAEAGALREKVSSTELAARKAKIAAMRQYMPTMKRQGHSIVESFSNEVEAALRRRIDGA